MLRERVSGTTDLNWFIDSGLRTFNEWNACLKSVNVDLISSKTVMDFGCGCGRVLRFLAEFKNDSQELIGADVDEEAIKWLDNNFREIKTVILPEVPPSNIAANSIDLIVSQSIFTHLPEQIQFQWMDELHRIAKPGGTVLTSFHGQAAADKYYQSLILNNLMAKSDEFLSKYNENGFFYIQGRSASEQKLPHYYGNAFHKFNYVESKLIKGRFKLKAFFPSASLDLQDIVILEKIRESSR